MTVQDVSGNGGAWLTVTPATFSTPVPIQVQMNPTGLAPGVYQKSIVFSGAAGNSPFTVPVTLTVTSTNGSSVPPNHDR